MKLSIIVAMNKDRVIGKDGKIPWSYPEDMRWFREKTMGSTVIMGRKTWESIGSRPLPYRNNIIVSKTLEPTSYRIENNGKVTAFVYSISGAIGFMHFLELERGWFIGGAGIYKDALDIATELWITQIPDKIEGENLTYFPKIGAEWGAPIFLNLDLLSVCAYKKIINTCKNNT
jgi:dihydrofolate reductase